MFDYKKYQRTWLNEESSKTLTVKEQNEEEWKKYRQDPNAHPISVEILDQVKEIEQGRVKRDRSRYTSSERWFAAFNGIKREIIPPPNANPCYVLDLDKNIIARLEAKYLVNSWIHHELGISVTNKTAYRYFTTKKLYKGKFYFVPVSEYEEFMKE